MGAGADGLTMDVLTMEGALDDQDCTSAAFARPHVVDALILRRARCYDPRGVYNHLFYSEDPVEIARAKAICARCEVHGLCLSRALERQEPCGVWGGQILHEGVIVARRPRRGRRPKLVVELVVDEVTGDEVTGLECRPIVDAG